MRVKLCLYAVCILILFFFQAGSALSDEALKLADRMLNEEHYDEAITECKRFIFFNPEDEQISHALYRMGLAYRAGHNLQDAIDTFRGSIRTAKDASIANERRIILATTLIASGNYSLARIELLRVLESSKDPLLHRKSLYFDGIASLYMYDWGAAEKAFDDFYSESSDGRMAKRAEEINSILFEARRSHRSAGLATFLSTMFPGLGQAYADHWRDGLNALALNSLTIGLLANAIYRKNHVNAALISSISMRYYLGNRYRAEMDVRKYNQSLDRQNALKILRLVQADEP